MCKLTGLYARPQHSDGLQPDADLLEACRFVLDEADAMNWRRQAAPVDMFGRRPGDLDDLAALAEVLRAGAPGFRFYASVALAALDVPCVSFGHQRLARRRRRRAASRRRVFTADARSAGRRLQALVTSAAQLPTARPLRNPAGVRGQPGLDL